MTFAEYKLRKDKLTAAIVRWMMDKQPDSETINRVTVRAENTMRHWWAQIENDPFVKIANKLVK